MSFVRQITEDGVYRYAYSSTANKAMLFKDEKQIATVENILTIDDLANCVTIWLEHIQKSNPQRYAKRVLDNLLFN